MNSEHICISLGGLTVSECEEIISTSPFVEFRLDLLTEDIHAELPRLIASAKKCIVAFHAGKSEASIDKRRALLGESIKSGAAFIDLDLADATGPLADVAAEARRCSALVVSYHNYLKTPALQELREIRATALAAHPHVVKIACMAHSPDDNATLIRLLDGTPGTLPIGMGEKGILTRLIAPLLGSPWTYAAPRTDARTAPGQLDLHYLQDFYARLGYSS